MKRNNKKGFTLIEVIAVLVIISIVVLIVTPIVSSIIRKAKLSANKRSVDAYGRTVELATVAYMLDDTSEPTSFDDLSIEYSGPKVECAINKVNYDGSAFLDKCTVNGKFVKDSKTGSGYYQYGRDTGKYMFTKNTDVVENNGNTSSGSGNNTSGSSETTSSTSLTVTYNGVSYIRLANVNVAAGYVALSTDKPLSYEDAIKYAGSIPVANVNGVGVVAYYTSDTCNESNQTGCVTDYDKSNVKIIIDAWAKDNLKDADATIITTEYLTNLGYSLVGNNVYQKTSSTPDSLFKLGVDYWAIDGNGNVYKGSARFSITAPYDVAAIRPIIIAKASDVKQNPNNNTNKPNNISNNTNNASNPYTVDMIIIFISILVIAICAIVYVMYVLAKNKKENANSNSKK